MKRLILIAVILLTSCSAPIYQIKSDCDKDGIFKKLNIVLAQNGFQMKINDSDLGYMVAETSPKFNYWTSLNEAYQWNFQFTEGVLFAQFKKVSFSKNVFGATSNNNEVYYNDQTDRDMQQYWNIRKMIDRICESKATIIMVE